MRKLLFALTALFFVPVISNAQIKLEVSENGAYRAKDSLEWTFSGITADPEAMEFIDQFPKAIEEPDTPILVEKESWFSFFKKEKKSREYFIIYEKESNNISFFSEVKIKDIGLNMYIIAVISIIVLAALLIPSCIYGSKMRSNKYMRDYEYEEYKENHEMFLSFFLYLFFIILSSIFYLVFPRLTFPQECFIISIIKAIMFALNFSFLLTHLTYYVIKGEKLVKMDKMKYLLLAFFSFFFFM